jgi:CDP-diacylglycerol--glycerol-3-phosphate 3-phosphatidyltransferase
MAALDQKLTQSWFTISNGLTLMRLVAAPFFYWVIVNQYWGVGCLLFWLAVATDVADGRLARARGETSVFGGLLDHATDAVFVALGNLALVKAGSMPALLPPLIIAAFLQYVFDSRILAGRELRASSLGRWNGIFYFVPPGVIVTREVLGLAVPVDQIISIVGWALVISSLISMGDRLSNVISVAREHRPRD